jgi:hypothetical protein
MYNRDITSIDDVKDDLSFVLKEYDLTSSNETISLDFKNYKKRKNFNHKVAFNGTASFFFEPLEASSLACAEIVNGIALDVWSGKMSASQANAEYEELMDATENMLAFHYIDNKSYSNDFWSHAKAISRKRLDEQLSSHNDFANNLKLALVDKQQRFFGTWETRSWLLNFEKMGIQYAA